MILRWIFSSIAVLITAYILPGVRVDDFWVVFVVALILAMIHLFVKPLVVLLTLPLTVLTLGLFLLVINACLVLLASAIVPGFHVAGFWWALLFSILLSLVEAIIIPKK